MRRGNDFQGSLGEVGGEFEMKEGDEEAWDGLL